MTRETNSSLSFVTARIACDLVFCGALEKERLESALSRPQSPITWCCGVLGSDERRKGFPQDCHGQKGL